jgi:hypothetical protein
MSIASVEKGVPHYGQVDHRAHGHAPCVTYAFPSTTDAKVGVYAESARVRLNGLLYRQTTMPLEFLKIPRCLSVDSEFA